MIQQCPYDREVRTSMLQNETNSAIGTRALFNFACNHEGMIPDRGASPANAGEAHRQRSATRAGAAWP
jgi:hypothetical protein